MDGAATDASSQQSGKKWVKPVALIAGLAIVITLGAIFDAGGKMQAALRWMQDLGPLGLAVLGLLYVVACVFFLPGSVLTLGAGFLAANLWPDNFAFALLIATITVSLSSVAGASVAFLLGRTLMRDWVSDKVRGNPKFSAVDDAIGRNGLKLVFLIRLNPIFPFNLLNYALGLTKVSFTHHLLASWAGMLPATVMYVYFGTAIQSVAALAADGRSAGAGRWITLGAGLVITIVVVTVITRIARNALNEAASLDAAGSAVEES